MKDIDFIKAKLPLSDATLKRNPHLTGAEIVSAKALLPSEQPPKTTEERLNKLERRFLAKLRSETDKWQYIGVQEITLRLGFDCRFTVDFHAVRFSGSIVMFETKGGFFRDDARVKLYAAAAKFPYFRFVLVRWENNQWIETVVKT